MNELDEVLARAKNEPIGVDLSDYSDEFCAGFLAGQGNVLDLLVEDSTELDDDPDSPTEGEFVTTYHLDRDRLA